MLDRMLKIFASHGTAVGIYRCCEPDLLYRNPSPSTSDGG